MTRRRRSSSSTSRSCPTRCGTSSGRARSGSAGTWACSGLGLHLATGATVDDPIAWQLSDEGRDFAQRSSEAWGAANVAAGADPDAAAQAVANTLAFYTTPPEGEPGEGS